MAGWFFPTAANVAETGPTARGANRTVTVHDLPGPKLAPEQVSAATLKAAEPATETVKAPEALPAAVGQREHPLRPRPDRHQTVRILGPLERQHRRPGPGGRHGYRRPQQPHHQDQHGRPPDDTARRDPSQFSQLPGRQASARPPESPAPETMHVARISHRQDREIGGPRR